MDNLTAITLPEQNGKYILTEDAVEKIKHADYLSISFETKNYKRIEENCWLRACFTGKIPGTNREVEARFQMPINVSDIEQYPADWEFKILEYTTVSAGTKHCHARIDQARSSHLFQTKTEYGQYRCTDQRRTDQRRDLLAGEDQPEHLRRALRRACLHSR